MGLLTWVLLHIWQCKKGTTYHTAKDAKAIIGNWGRDCDHSEAGAKEYGDLLFWHLQDYAKPYELLHGEELAEV